MTVGSIQGKAFSCCTEAKACMQAIVPGIVVRPDNQETMCRHGGLLGIVQRDPPFPGIGGIVRQIVSAHIPGYIGCIIDLDPIVGLALRVLEGLTIGGHQLIDPQVRLCHHLSLEHTDDHQGKKPNSKVSTRVYHPFFLSYAGSALYRGQGYFIIAKRNEACIRKMAIPFALVRTLGKIGNLSGIPGLQPITLGLD